MRMSPSGFSLKYGKEVSPVHYLTLLGENTISHNMPLDKVNCETRDTVFEDIICPECGAHGARLVASNHLDANLQRQIYFRFVTEQGDDAHDRHCELADSATYADPSASAVDFSQYRTAAGQFVVAQLAKALSHGFIPHHALTHFRRWHTDLKVNHLVDVELDPAMLYHYFLVYSRRHDDGMYFHPKMLELPNLDIDKFVIDRIAREDTSLYKKIKTHDTLFVRHDDLRSLLSHTTLFDVRVLNDAFYTFSQLKSLVLANTSHVFMAQECKLLDAYLSLLLFVNDWCFKSALFMYIDIVQSPSTDCRDTENRMGFTPFSHYLKVKALLNINDVRHHLLTDNAITVRKQEEKKQIQQEYQHWSHHQRDNCR
ncbi:hypothetical protein BZJ17_15040 [Salinivibrio sp. IB574]|uniref:hypothetical protein n=1 Tax=Salinivibrio sp. IB574 TaxID=1909444 RepID=UPI00098955C9|nr:hypothetical protein [Salinivibrio sp. IB574]OOF19709.1 hypothetical protein BZJ17_15040 [Salinivibrio sp. IB574]